MNRSTMMAAIVGAAFALLASACAGTPVVDGASAAISENITPGDPIAGAKAYRNVCATCHGADLGGVEELGGPLLPSAFIIDRTDDELVAFIIEGRPEDHPENITGIAMTPRGGNPSLTNQDIANIVRYIKAQQPTDDG